MEPRYLKTYQEGLLDKKIHQLNDFLSDCHLCPRQCHVNRLKGEKGFCSAGAAVRISAHFCHFGEEFCLVGKFGSGTIFFSHCNLKCVFCQNYEISHGGEGVDMSYSDLAQFMLDLQTRGCHNINLVTPTHYAPQILESLKLAIEAGLRLPLVYNCGGYESEEVLDILDGIVDIYMPDVKFSSSEISQEYTQAEDYFKNIKRILKMMHDQVGDLTLQDGVAVQGLLVRHLVLPDGLAGTQTIMQFIAKEISKETYVNIMAQYRPAGEAYLFPRLNRALTLNDYLEAKTVALSCGLNRFD